MTRDERKANRENMTGVEAAQEVVRGERAFASLGSSTTYVLDVQAAVDKTVSATTKNRRQWDRATLYAAYKAARPIVEQNLRQQGKTFTRDEVKAAVRPRVAAYVSKYGVTLPTGTRVGATALEAIAGDVCGAFSMPWTAFMPPQVQIAAKAAQEGSPKAQGWLKKLFGGGGKPAPVAPVSAPVLATAQATAPAAKTATDSAGYSQWSIQNPSRRNYGSYRGRYGSNTDRGQRYGSNSNQNERYGSYSNQNERYGSDSNQDGRRRRRRHHRRNRDQGNQQNYQYPTGQYNPNLPISSSNQPTTNQFNPSISQQAVTDYQAAHGSTAATTTYNPYLPTSSTNQPTTTTNTTATTTDNTTDYTIYGAPLSLSDSLGAFLYKVNPLYWLKSAEERKLIDAEKQAWIDNAKLRKQSGKREEVLEQGKKALEAKQAVAVAQARAAEIEAQLKAIETQVSGACLRSTTLGKADILGNIGPAEILGADKKKSSPYGEKENPFTETIPSEDAAPVLKKIRKARELNTANEAELAPICAKLQNGGGLNPDETAKVLILLARNEQLHEFRKNLVNGELYAKNPSAKALRRNVMMGAVAVMTPTEQSMLSKISALAKQGNPNASKALEALKAQGYAVTMGAVTPTAQIPGKPMTPAEQQQLAALVAMAKKGNAQALKAIATLNERGYSVTLGSTMGWGISDAFSLALKPITVPAKYLWKGTKKVARAIGLTKGSSSPEQVRLGRLKAAQQRARAAQARSRAADAQSEAEYRAQQALASAADAEADAADAEATAKEAAMQTAEAEYLPGQTDASDSSTDSSTDSSGRSAPVITQLPDTPVPPTPTAVKLMAQRRALVAKKNPRAAKILEKSEENSPAGMKLKASMEFYKKAEKRKSKERKAAAMMVAKAKRGDKQALADVQALKAAGIAVKAERSAGRRVAAAYAYRATTAKVTAARKKAEVAMSDKLIRRSRAKQLAKVAKIERGAAAGNKPCQRFVKTHVAKAKAGDKNSKKVVAALLLAKNARTVAPTKREQKKLRAAGKMVKRIGKGDKQAIRDSRIIVAAAKHGNPNAKAARKKLQTAAAYEQTLRTGAIVLPAVVVTSELALKRQKAKKAADQKKLAAVETKIKKGTASREEAQAAAKAAADEGDKAKAAELMATAATLPSAGEELKRVATVAAAATAGNPKYRASVENAAGLAAQGDPAGIEAMGKLAGVKALNDVSNGKPIDPAMKTAVQDIEKAQAGDPVAAEKLATMQDQAAEKVPAAIKYMVAATGAAVVARALANNPTAQEEWKEKAGAKPRTDTEKDAVVVDAEIVTPGMSSLPDAPLPPVRGVVGLFKAALSAVALATKDPFQNYREGVASRAKRLGPVSSSGDELPAARDDLDQLMRNALNMGKNPNEGDYRSCAWRINYDLQTPHGSNYPQSNEYDRAIVALYAKNGDYRAQELMSKMKKVGMPSPSQKDIDYAQRSHLAYLRFVKDHVSNSATFLRGDDPAASRDKLVADTKARLQTLVNAATAGDKKAQGKWDVARANYTKARARAAKGDSKAKDVVSILEATGLFVK